MKKRLISMLLAVLMVASLFGGMSVSAYADEEYETQEYTVKEGDTLFRICNKLGLNWFNCEPAIQKLNGLKSSDYTRLSVGQSIDLPASNEDALKIMKASTASTTTTTTSGTGSSATTTTTTTTPGGTNANAAFWLISYTMQKGETVAGVCNSLGINFNYYSKQIMAINNISAWNKVAAGKTLLLPSASAPAAGTSCIAVIAHQIQKGETTYSICNQYGISYNASASLMQNLNNGTSLTNIKYGKTLFVPVPTVITSGSTTGSTGGTVISGGGSSSGSGSTTGGSTTGGSTTGGSTTGGSTTGGSATKTYKLTGSATGGSISFTVGGKTVTSAAAGSTVTVVPSPNSGYGLKSASLRYADGSAAPELTNGSFTMPACDVRVSATFEKGFYMGPISAHGTITCYNADGVATSTAATGATIKVVVSPDAGYKLKTLYVQRNNGPRTNVKVGMKSGDTFTMVDGPVFVCAEYEETTTYELKKVDTDLKGSFKTLVNGGAVSKAAAGARVEIVCSPATGYAAEDKDITVINKAYNSKIPVVDGYFTMPASAVEISVNFQPAGVEKYTLTAGSEYQGTVSFLDSSDKEIYTAEQGWTVKVKPAFRTGYDSLYYVEKYVIKGAGNTQEIGPSDTFTMPGYDVTVTPVFKPYQATIDKISSNDSSLGDIVVTVDGKNVKVGDSVALDTSIKVTVPKIAKPGYEVDCVKVHYLSGSWKTQTLKAGESWTIASCTNIEVEVVFKVTDFTLKVEDNWIGCFNLNITGGADAGLHNTPKAGDKFQVPNTTWVGAVSTDPAYKVIGFEVTTYPGGKLTTYTGDSFQMPADHIKVKVLMEPVAAPTSLALEEPEALSLEP